MKKLKTEIKQTINIIKNLLKKNVKIYNSLNGRVIEYGNSYEDLADYIPFLIYFNEFNISKKEVEKTIKYLKKNQYLYHKKETGINKYFTKSYDQQDLIFGLILASEIDKSYLKEAEKTINSWKNNFFKNNKLSMAKLSHCPIINFKIPKKLQIAVPIISLQDHGMFIELYTILYEKTKNRDYLENAIKIYNKLINIKKFKQKKFFPFYASQDNVSKFIYNHINIFKSKDNEFQLLKQNSNTLIGVLRLYRNLNGKMKIKVKNDIEKTIDSWINMFFDKNKKIFYTNYNIKTKIKCSNLTVFHIIDILTLAYIELKNKKYLNYAEIIANSFIKYKNKNSGLIPFYHPLNENNKETLKIGKNSSWLDTEVDFQNSLIRLYEITKNNKYLKNAKEITKGIVNYHKKKYGYAGSIDIKNLNVIESEYSFKNTGLILKIFISLKEWKNINNLNHKIYYILQDR